MFFLAEYNSMLAMSTFYTILFLGGWGSSWGIIYLVKIIVVAFTIVLIRAELPRYRFDQLISLCWKSLLPVVLLLVFLLFFCQIRFGMFLFNYGIVYREVSLLNNTQYAKYGL
jgi:NADH:ubiquinone oxidoreductase subunit H